jgi:hypothetical protein
MEGDGPRFETNTRERSVGQCGLGTTKTLTLDLKIQGFPKLQYFLCPDHECDYKRLLI